MAAADHLSDAQMWHVSPSRNTDSILRSGLIPKVGARSTAAGERQAGIYLFSSRQDAENASWMADAFDEDESLSLFEVSLPKNHPTSSDVEWEVRTHRSIPPERVRLVQEDF